MKAKEWRIIRDYADFRQLKPELSIYPIIHFTDSRGQLIKISLMTMRDELEHHKVEQIRR